MTFNVANVAGSPVLSTFSFSGFTDLTQVSVEQGFFQDHGTSWQFDNVNLNSAVPEPSTWAMIILGFFGIGFMAYRTVRGKALFVSSDLTKLLKARTAFQGGLFLWSDEPMGIVRRASDETIRFYIHFDR